MIDPIHSLAFSVQGNPKVYAVLLGSGVSRGANIPTGWEITLDLIRKIAALYQESCDPDPTAWYRERFGTEPRYTDLLGQVAKTPAERQQMLRGYIEPTKRERKEGEKCPTPAHRAIAALVARGFIKVILTTNFDRLLETALGDEGVAPTVLSTPDQVRGALPLVHVPCCVFKLHGDYLDPGIRNTDDEVREYPAEYNKLLDRIFDEFGLIVCGWSAEWDDALYAAIMRAPSRRFTTYWATKGQTAERAQKLIDTRVAQEIPIDNADEFFCTIQEQVVAVDEFSRPHPLSTQAAITTLKRYLSEPRYRIQLSGLVDKTTEQAVLQIAEKAVPVDLGTSFDSEMLMARVRTYETACSTLMAMAFVGGAWAEEDHYQVWRRALQRLDATANTGGIAFWLNLQRYPQTLLLYALGIGAIHGSRLSFIEYIATTNIRGRFSGESALAIMRLPPTCLLDTDHGVMRRLEGMEKRHLPLTEWMYGVLRAISQEVISDDSRFEYAFDKLEMLISLAFIYHGKSDDWTPPGAYGYRRGNAGRILKRIEGSLQTEGESSPFVVSGVFGRNVEECTNSVRILTKVRPRWI